MKTFKTSRNFAAVIFYAAFFSIYIFVWLWLENFLWTPTVMGFFGGLILPVVYIANLWKTNLIIGQDSLEIKPLIGGEKIEFSKIRSLEIKQIGWVRRMLLGIKSPALEIKFNKFDEILIYPEKPEELKKLIESNIQTSEIVADPA